MKGRRCAESSMDKALTLDHISVVALAFLDLLFTFNLLFSHLQKS